MYSIYSDWNKLSTITNLYQTTKTMNKSQLIDAIAKQSKIKKSDAKKAIDAFIEITNNALKTGERVSIIGLGAFSILQKPSRTGRNPKSGEKITIAAKSVVKFKPCSELETAVK